MPDGVYISNENFTHIFSKENIPIHRLLSNSRRRFPWHDINRNWCKYWLGADTKPFINQVLTTRIHVCATKRTVKGNHPAISKFDVWKHRCHMPREYMYQIKYLTLFVNKWFWVIHCTWVGIFLRLKLVMMKRRANSTWRPPFHEEQNKVKHMRSAINQKTIL